MPIEVIMPSLGAVAEEATLVRWLIREGDTVAKGQVIFEAESDKATVEIEAPESGKVFQLLASEGDLIPNGTVIALLLAEGEPMPEAPPSMIRENQTVQESYTAPPIQDGKRLVASPLARRLAREKGIDLAKLRGTGPGGRIIVADVKDALEAMPPSFTTLTGLTGLRASVARRMAESSQITAPVTLTTEIDAEPLVELREMLQREADEHVISYNLLLAVICAHALRDHPQINASLTPQGIVQHRDIHIGIAVDTPRGLLVAVLRNVPQRGLLELGADLQAKIARLREGKASPDDLSGATFTITNLGMFGIDAFTPIINLPEAAILGVGRIRAKPVEKRGEIMLGKTMVLSLTFDHRLVDGAPAARFLQRVSYLIEHPALLWLR